MAYPKPFYVRRTVPGAGVKSTLRRPAAKVVVRAASRPMVTVAPRGRFVPTTHRATSLVVRNNGPCPLPDNLYTSFVVQNNLTFTTDGAGGVASHTLLPNSMFDPFSASGAAQPRFYDQLCNATMYGRYTVMSCKVKVSALTLGAAGAVPGRMLVTFTPSSTNTFTDPYTASEAPNSVWFDTSGQLDHYPTRQMIVQMGAIFGRTTRQILDDDVYGAVFSANPDRLCFGYMNFRVPTESSATTIYIAVRMEFRVRISQLNVPAVS